jgi:hypothetical protein
MQSRAPSKGSRKNKGILEIARQVSATIGAEFFRSMVQHLSQALSADCVYIGEFVGGQVERVRTLATSVDGQTDVNFDYPLAGSASAGAALGRISVCGAGAQNKFPEDTILPRLAAEAFIGVPLMNANQQALGILMAVYRRPVHSPRVPRSMLEIFAPRAAAELSRKQADEQLRESEERHRSFIAANPDGMWRVELDPPVPISLPEVEQVERIHRDGYIAECNDALALFLGREKAEELIGCRLSDFEEMNSDFSVRRATLAAVRVGYRLTNFETWPMDRYGKRHYMLRSQWGVVEDGMLQRVWGTSRDITALRKSEMALDASERRLADLLETIHMVVVMLDLTGSITFCNDYLLKLTGWQFEEISGKNWFNLMIPEEERETLRATFESAKTGSNCPVLVESTLLGPGGQNWSISWDCAILSDTGGKIAAAVYVGRDVTAYKKLEAEFRHAQKLESIGRLASGVAHDFNNLLTVIIGYTGVLLTHRDPTDPAYIPLAEIKKAAEKGSDLAYQLLTFSSRRPFRSTPLNLNTLITENQRMLHRLIGENIQLVTNLDPALGTIRADAGHLHQVLLNLAVNARDAMPQGGKLAIASSNVDINGIQFPQLPGLAPGSYVQLTIADNGIGMTEEIREHLFEPFFTTKAPGKGTGLGLSTVYGIIQESIGHIFVDTKPHQGTTFSILFPRIEPKASTQEVTTEPSLKGGTETILLVEDQYEVRVLAASILRELGYNVWEAEGPDHALELAQYSGAPIHLILTDMVMPRMTGIELADRIRSIHPKIKTLLMSGYPEPLVLYSDSAVHCAPCIEKPFTPEHLSLIVRQTLDEA